jgi:hypothetical protein
MTTLAGFEADGESAEKSPWNLRTIQGESWTAKIPGASNGDKSLHDSAVE